MSAASQEKIAGSKLLHMIMFGNTLFFREREII